MIDLEVYDVLEKIINQRKDELADYKREFFSETQQSQLEINAIQSLIRQVVIDKEADFNPIYSRLKYRKEGYETEKLSNLEFDMEFLLTLLANVPELAKGETYAVIMFVLTILVEIRKCKVRLMPSMSVIVSYLFENEYQKKFGRTVNEQQLKKEVKDSFQKYDDIDNFERAIDGLVKLKVILLHDGEIQLIEKVVK